LPTEGRTASFVGWVGAELAAMNAVAIARQHLGPVDRVKRIVRPGVSMALGTPVEMELIFEVQ
jgi:hypothetical protein